MPNTRLSMRKIKEVLRLKYARGLSNRQVARICGIARPTVSEYLRRAGDEIIAQGHRDALILQVIGVMREQGAPGHFKHEAHACIAQVALHAWRVTHGTGAGGRPPQPLSLDA